MSYPIAEGVILHDHYRVISILGQGGFGRTYLAVDTHRFQEHCVLKEFAPQAQGTETLNKAQELFEREANVLYRLKHPQIPRFLEMFRATWQDHRYLFLVQEYVEGKSYRHLLQERQQHSQCFTELEITQLFWQLLPVLEYIHSLGVIHRDISPDNLMWRQSDSLPILIDFGGVKQIAATVQSEWAGTPATPGMQATRLGKQGYVPDEQMRLGVVSPDSDLYALAATALVLLTGKEPQFLIDPATLTWNWRSFTHLSPQFSAIIDKMLAHRPEDRYHSSRQVLDALAGETVVSHNSPPAVPPLQSTEPPPDLVIPSTVLTSPPQPSRTGRWLPQGFLILALILGMGSLGWLAGNHWLSSQTPPFLTLSEPERQQMLSEHRQDLDISEPFFIGLVNELFYHQYPEQANRTLTADAADAIWRQRWDVIAHELLEILAQLQTSSRQKLGDYSVADIQRWRREVNALHVSSRALNDLTDGIFFQLFPQQKRGENLIGRPLGQVWQAIATEQVAGLQQGKTLEKITFDPQTTEKTVTGTLKPGGGQIYIATLQKGQTLQVSLKATPAPFLSIYTPGRDQPPRAFVEDAKENQWLGKLDESGYYEFVIVSDSTKPLSYELTISSR